MIDPEKLVPGKCYFHFAFCHPKLDIPRITTLIYVGKNLFPQEASEDEWYFQDPESYLEHGSFINFKKKIEHERLLLTKDSLVAIYDLKGLIDQLKELKEC
ncbi:MAG: hypothetical protein C4520_10680 [Candidatus Abyssobacteria bacterium SURF_5]|uniref:Uncharacterized protein n=1 Tax=Abyssobacteria bacterium (strain SURF_5) TaxID=2093360 RepID=A0A3A4NYY4_ABYX5|nr:MAG: hypothetical protein C4520_10680 [Candidatus Abyssubacteria bacterium SURF_5]